LETRPDFLAYAEKLSEQIAERHEHTHYLTFVNSLVERMIGPSISFVFCLLQNFIFLVTKLQLEIVRSTVQV